MPNSHQDHRALPPAGAASDVQADELYAAIMNLPCKVPDNGINYQRAYSEGHRDARHAASELVLAHKSALRTSHTELVRACGQASFALRELLPKDADAQLTVAMLNAALDNARKVTQ